MTNGNANEDAAGTITPPTVNLILQGKGGIGKSVVASWLAEFLIGRGQPVCCIDGDPVNRSLGQYKALGAEKLDLRRQQSVLLYPSPAQETEGAAGRDVSQLGAQITKKNLNVQPTIKIPAGYKFNVRVNRDILFEEPYRPVEVLIGGSRK